MAFNTLRTSRLFTTFDKTSGITKTLQTCKFEDYTVPKEFINSKLPEFNMFKVPFVKQVTDAIKDGRIIFVMLSEPTSSKSSKIDMHVDKSIPYQMFNIPITMKNGKKGIIVDLSYVGKYTRDKTNTIEYFSIPINHLFYMALCGYIILRIYEDPTISSNPTFYGTASQYYALMMSKIIDNIMPVEASSVVDFDKLYFLCNCFALQSMWLVPKDTAVKQALKLRQIRVSDDVLQNSCYINDSNANFMNCDYKDTFPIDIFCQVLHKEYPTLVDENKMNPGGLLLQYTRRFSKNASFSMEHSLSFINLLILSGEGELNIYNDYFIKQYFKSSNKKFLDVIQSIVK